LVKIALDLKQALRSRELQGAAGRAAGRPLARGDGWSVEDVICTSGPSDRTFEERHGAVSIAIVVAGTFQYRSPAGRALMTPGSLLLGAPGQCFECGHEHASGDRCIAFRYAPALFERIAADAGAPVPAPGLRSPRLPPVRELSPVIARACGALLSGDGGPSWEEMAIGLAARVARLTTRSIGAAGVAPPSAFARVTHAVRAIERESAGPLTLRSLAAEAGLSPYHFLRTFERITGLTPHQFVRRTRLRDAAVRLSAGRSKIAEVVFDSGFGDVSNFNRAFRAEFGVSPRAHRLRTS
jgi:AraC-like DNA-binding protein